MLAYNFVEGDGLTQLVLATRQAFIDAGSQSDDDGRSVRLVAISLFERRSQAERRAIVEDLLDANHDLFISRDPSAVFEQATAPSDFITDLVAEVVWQILMRDPVIAAEEKVRDG